MCVCGISDYEVVKILISHVWFGENGVGVGNYGFWIKQSSKMTKIPLELLIFNRMTPSPKLLPLLVTAFWDNVQMRGVFHQ